MLVNKVIIGCKEKAKKAITISNKPTLIRFKVWCVINQGFLLLWIWHILGKGNRLVGVRMFCKLEGFVYNRKEDNKT
jgi:hypothetical protein